MLSRLHTYMTSAELPAMRPPRRSSDFTGPQTAVMFAALALVASIPIITHPLPPMTDYVNHLARMHVIASVNHDGDLGKYYQIDWQIVPNLMMELIVPLLERVMNIYQAGQVYTVMSFMLILSGTVMLNRAL